MTKRNLSKYNNSGYYPGRNAFIRGMWYIANVLFFKSACWPYYGFKRTLLRCFGAKIGKGVVIKPCVNIKYPWHLTVGDYTWIGEGVWIDNLTTVTIGSNCCVSQGAMLLCGNHDYTKETFDLMVAPVCLEDGAWVGAKVLVCPGVTVGAGAVLTAGAVATKDLAPEKVYQGNPAVEKKN